MPVHTGARLPNTVAIAVLDIISDIFQQARSRAKNKPQSMAIPTLARGSLYCFLNKITGNSTVMASATR